MVMELMVDPEHLVLRLKSCGFQQLLGNMEDGKENQVLCRPQAKSHYREHSLDDFSHPLPACSPSSRLPPAPCPPTVSAQLSLASPSLEVSLPALPPWSYAGISWPSGKTDVPSKHSLPLRPGRMTLSKLDEASEFPPLWNGLLLEPTSSDCTEDCMSHVYKVPWTLSGISGIY